MEDEFDLVGEYEKLRGKFGLPEFVSLAEDFDIEKIGEKETGFLAREIRRAIGEKLSAYLHFFENLINPSSPPMFVFSILRGLEEGDKEAIKKIYKRLSKLQVLMMKLDVIYSEEKEVEYILKSFGEWQDLKKEICSLVESFEENLEKDNGSKKSGYFG